MKVKKESPDFRVGKEMLTTENENARGISTENKMTTYNLIDKSWF